MTQNQKFIKGEELEKYEGKIVGYECYPHMECARGIIVWSDLEKGWIIQTMGKFRKYFIEQGISTYAVAKEMCMWEASGFRIVTGQYYDTRQFFFEGDDDKHIIASPEELPGWEKVHMKQVVDRFLAECKNQTGVSLEVTSQPESRWWTINMDTWPEDEAFGDWFNDLMEWHSVRVID